MRRTTIRRVSDAVAVAGILGACFLAGNPAVGLVFGAVGQNLLAGLTDRGWRHCRQRYLTDAGLLNHDVQGAMRRAFALASVHLMHLWWTTPRGAQQRRDKAQRETVEGLFAALRE